MKAPEAAAQICSSVSSEAAERLAAAAFKLGQSRLSRAEGSSAAVSRSAMIALSPSRPRSLLTGSSGARPWDRRAFPRRDGSGGRAGRVCRRLQGSRAAREFCARREAAMPARPRSPPSVPASAAAMVVPGPCVEMALTVRGPPFQRFFQRLLPPWPRIEAMWAEGPPRHRKGRPMYDLLYRESRLASAFGALLFAGLAFGCRPLSAVPGVEGKPAHVSRFSVSGDPGRIEPRRVAD